MNWWRNFWVATDVWVSNWIWADPNITISSKTAEARADGKWWGKAGCKVLNFLFQTQDHCSGAIDGDIDRAKKAAQELERYKDGGDGQPTQHDG